MRGKLNDEHVRQPVEGLETGKAFKVERIRRIPGAGYCWGARDGFGVQDGDGADKTARKTSHI